MFVAVYSGDNNFAGSQSDATVTGQDLLVQDLEVVENVTSVLTDASGNVDEDLREIPGTQY